MQLIASFLQQKHVPLTITFAQFRERFHKMLFVTTWCVHDQATECMSHRNHPDMEILTALRMSISIPFLFRPVTWMGKMYVDGGLFDNFPVRYATKKHSIGIHIHIQTMIKDPMDITNFINVIVRSVTKAASIQNSKKYKHPCTIDLHLPENEIINFDMSRETKELLFTLGCQQAREYVEKNIQHKK